MRLFRLRQSFAEDAPDLDLDDFDGDWDNPNARHELKSTGAHMNADLFPLAGTPGVASKELGSLLVELSVGSLTGWDVVVDGRECLLLRWRTTLDILDRDASDLTYFRRLPEKVKSVESYTFARLPEADVFTIPELPVALLLTERARSAVAAKKPRGVVLDELVCEGGLKAP